jgi:2-polyprenyl-3-methyl-5-hydroxy-6-metoxy-1,4-benzoquinol methylase
VATRGTPRWYAALLRVEELVLRRTIGARLRARDAHVELGGPANRVRHPTLGHVAAERLIPGIDAPADELEFHVARYAWAFRFCEGRRVLDVGCGAGYGSSLLAWVADSVTAVDRDETAIDVAKRMFTGPDYRVLDATDPLPKADVATCFEVLEHVDDPAGLCRQLVAAAPEIVLSYPNPLAAGPHLNPHHRVDWPLGTFKAALRDAGAGELRLFHQRTGSPAIRRGAPPWAAVWLVHGSRT